MSPWSLRCVWPVEDETLGYRTAVEQAEQLLDEVADNAGARIVGPVEWSMVEHDQPEVWPHTQLALVAIADAVPARPTREQLPQVVAYYAGQKLTDTQIARELGIPKTSVVHVRRKHQIPAGCPPGYRDAGQVGVPAWP